MLDSDKLYKKLANDPELRKIPLIYIVQVATKVIELIGECLEVNDV